MSTFFTVLFLLSLAGLAMGLVKPQWVKMPSRKMAGGVFGSAAVVSFILFGITMPSTPQPVATSATPVATSSEVADTSNASTTLGTGAHGATQAKTKASPEQPVVAPAPKPAISVSQQPAAPAPSQPATLTDSGYLQDFNDTVMPFIGAIGSDVLSGNAEIANSNVASTSVIASADVSAGLADYQQGQSDLAQAQAALQTLQGEAPPDMANINTLATEYLNSQATVMSLFIGYINSNTLGISQTLSAYTQMGRSNLYLSQLSAAMTQSLN